MFSVDIHTVAKAFGLPSLSSFLSTEPWKVDDEVFQKRLWEGTVEYTADIIIEKARLYLSKVGNKYYIKPLGGRSGTWLDAVKRIAHIMTAYGFNPNRLPKTESGAKRFVMKNWPLLALDHKVFGGKSPERIFWDYVRNV